MLDPGTDDKSSPIHVPERLNQFAVYFRFGSVSTFKAAQFLYSVHPNGACAPDQLTKYHSYHVLLCTTNAACNSFGASEDGWPQSALHRLYCT
eukprot:1145110-Pelagomonas_calceolata.AAC.2